MDIPLGSKLRYPDLVGSPSRATRTVPPSRSGLSFPSLPSGACPDSPSQVKLAVNFSGLLPILPRRLGRSWQFRKVKCDNKVEYNLLGLGGLRNFCCLHPVNIARNWKFWRFRNTYLLGNDKILEKNVPF